jgi:membrane-associated protease RseP (regulator of RpoE activity)
MGHRLFIQTAPKMKPLRQAFIVVMLALLARSAPAQKTENELSVPPTSVPSSSTVTSPVVDPEAKVPGTSSSDTDPIKLEPLVTTERTQLSFQFSIRVTRSQPTNQLIAMYVDQVLPGSNAEEVRLVPGAMIVSINGKPVAQYEASFRSGSELSKILVGRREGDEVTLVVIDPDETKPKKIVVTRRTRMQVRSW